jgi:phosphoribosylglycinamide formyltransferase-1
MLAGTGDPGGLVASRHVRVAVLVSGAGSILDAMVDAAIPIALVVADRPCRGLERAAEAGIEAVLVERDRYDADFDRDAYAARLAEVLRSHDIELVAMAGFGTVLSQPMHDAFGGRLINTHPALLPSFKGWHAVRDALAHGVKVTGCTVHVAGLDVDTGPILAQEAVAVLPDDTEATLHERIKEVERRLYPDTLRRIIDEGILP